MRLLQAFAVMLVVGFACSPSVRQVPDAPTNVVAIAGNGQATLSWTAPERDGGSAITGYTVTSTPGGTTTTVTATSAVITGLANGTSYTFTVHATNAVGNGSESVASNAVTPIAPATIPDAPTNVVAVAGNGQATLSWTAPERDGGSAITGYTVTTTPGGTTTTVTATSAVIAGLTNGTSYTFTVHATNAVGNSSESAPSASVTPIAPATIPDAPTNVVAVAGNGQATISWMAPERDGGSAITGYAVTTVPGGTTTTVTATSAVITGLTNGTSYTFTVHATNAVGNSPESAPSASVTPIAPATIPDAPTNVVAVAGNGQATLSWTAPEHDGGSAITGYTVTTAPGGTTTTVTATSAVITGLTNGTSYTFTVHATNAVGNGPQSVASNAVTPMAPATIPDAPTNVVVVAGNGQATVSWTAPERDGGSAITGYTVTTAPGGTTTTVTATSAVITGLTNGTSYTFTVHATNAVGNGPQSVASNAITPATVPDAPTDVVAVAGDGQAMVLWSAPVETGGALITGYTVTASPGDLLVTTTGATSALITGLTNGTSYTFTVRATNLVGDGPESVASNAVTPAAAVTVPAAPTNVLATGGQGQATVSWTAPEETGGAPITGYIVTAMPGSLTVTTTGATSAVITDLTNGTSYTFTVHATNAAGAGPESVASNAITPATVPEAPTDVVAVAGDGQASVTWTAPEETGGAAISGYTVTTLPGGAETTVTTTSVVIPDLTNGTSYTFTVRATNAVGHSPESAESNAVTPAPGPRVPAAPTNVVATADGTQVVVSWDPPLDDGGRPIQSYFVAATPGPAFAVADGSATSAIVTGLETGVAYTFTVFAINEVGSGATSASSAPVMVGTTPGAPQSVTAVAGNRTVFLSWLAPAEDGGAQITHYTVTTWPGGATTTTDGTTLSIPNLTNGSSYTFTVTAANALGDGPASAPSNPVTPAGPPGTPIILSIVPGDGRVTVTFAPPADDGGSPITAYVVTASPGGASVTVPVVSNGPSRRGRGLTPTTYTAEFTGLQNGTQYAFSVAAINGVSRGADSAPSEPAAPGAVPGPPLDVQAIADDQVATVRWTAPDSSGDASISGYTVVSSPGELVATTTGATEVLISGLTNGTHYTFVVIASNAFGSGPASEPSSPVTPLAPAVPDAPQYVVATAGDGQVTVSWDPPASDGRRSILSYTVTASPGGQTTTTAATSVTLSGLTNGVAYTFTVHATNSVGDGPESVSSESVVPASVPAAPPDVTAVPGDRQVLVSWTAPADGGSPITSYRVTSSPEGKTATTSGTSATIAGLTNGTSYTFTVVATNARGSGAASSASVGVTPNIVPNAPTNVTASSLNSSASVSWTAPVSNGGTPVLSYTVTASPGGFSATTTGTTATVTGLTNGTSYTFTVVATNALGASVASAPSAAVVPGGVPGPPLNARTSGSPGLAKIWWDPPTSCGDAPILGFTVTATPGGQSITTTGASTAFFPGLTPGVAYTFQVAASNRFGLGALSQPTPALTLQAGSAPPAPTAVRVNATDVSNGVAWVRWAPSSGTVTSYTATASPGGMTGTTTTETFVPVVGLTTGATYTFTVTASNSYGTSPPSAPTAPVLIDQVPKAPGIITATAGNGSAVVSWTPAATPGTPLTGYMVTGTPGGISVQTAGERTVTVTGLTNGTSYTFTVHGINAAGNGPESPKSAAVVPKGPTVPSAPSISRLQPANAEVTVSWTPPSSDGGSRITSYIVTASPGGATATTPGTSATVTGLTNGTSYTFTVSAVNAIGVGPAGTYSLVAIPQSPVRMRNESTLYSIALCGTELCWNGLSGVGRLAKEGGATVTVASDRSLSPTAVAGDGTNVYWTENGGGTGRVLQVPRSGGTATTLATGQIQPNDLAVDATSVYWSDYGSHLILKTPLGGGALSTVSSGAGSPFGVMLNGSNIFWTDQSQGLIKSTGLNGGAISTLNTGTTTSSTRVALDSTSLYYGSSDGTVFRRALDGSSPATLATGQTGIRDITTDGTTLLWSAGSNIVMLPSAGGTPTTLVTSEATPNRIVADGLMVYWVSNDGIRRYHYSQGNPPNPPPQAVAASGDGKATLTWTTPSAYVGPPVSAYLVTVSPGGQAINAYGTSTTITGLTNGTTYTFEVQAINAQGTSAATQSNAVTPALVTVPGIPSDVTVTAGDGVLHVSFSPAPTDGGSPIQYYEVRTQPPLGYAKVVSGTTADVFVDNGYSYAAYVTAVNSIGSGPPSFPSATVIASGLPKAATAVIAKGLESAAQVSWQAPSGNGQPILGYTVVSSPGGVTTTAIASCLMDDGQAGLCATVPGLVNGTTYTFTVQATNANGAGAVSPPSNPALVGGAQGPGAPTNVVATPDSFGPDAGSLASLANITWTAPSVSGSGPLLGYIVTAWPGGLTAAVVAPPAQIGGLVVGTTYTFTVHAFNALAWGAESAPSAPVTAFLCAPESDAALCAQQSAQCDAISVTDSCGHPRDVDCGSCDDGGESCNSNRCVCSGDPWDTGDTLCAVEGLTCSTVTFSWCGASYTYNCRNSNPESWLCDAYCTPEELCGSHQTITGNRFNCGQCESAVCDVWTSTCRPPSSVDGGNHVSCENPVCDAQCVWSWGTHDCGMCDGTCRHVDATATRKMLRVDYDDESKGALQNVAVGGGRIYWTGNNKTLNFVAFHGATKSEDRFSNYHQIPLAQDGFDGDATSFYWLGDGGVWQEALNFTSPLRLATTTHADFLNVDDTSVYWIDSGSLLRVPKGGGSLATLASTSAAASGMVVQSGSLYWSESDTGNILQTTTSGGAAVTLASGQLHPKNLRADATGIYWTTDDALVRSPVAGGGPITIASGLTKPQGFAVDGVSVYWTNGTDDLLKMSVQGGAVSTVAHLMAPTRVFVTDTSVYVDSFSPVGVSGSTRYGGLLEIIPK